MRQTKRYDAVTPPTAPRGASARVIILGPGPDEVGGMASVTAQMMSMAWPDRYETELLSNSYADSTSELRMQKLTRHVRQIRRLTSLIGDGGHRADGETQTTDNDSPDARSRPRRRTISNRGAVLVHIHTCSGFSFYRSTVDMLAAQRAGARVVLHIHGAAFHEFVAHEPRWRRRVIAWSLARADRVIALSSQWAVTLSAIAPKARVTVIENAVAIPQAQPTRRAPGPCRFVLMARMDVWKGIDDLLDAAAAVHRRNVSFDLTLAGPSGTAGDARTLESKIENRGLTGVVRYIGCVRGDEKDALLLQSDVYVQPSHHEGMPIAMLEALAYALPVVATAVGAVGEVITDGVHGLLVPAHSPDRLAEAMIDLISSESRRPAMSTAARALATDRFGLDRFQHDLGTLYDDVLSPSTTEYVNETTSAKHASIHPLTEAG